MKLEIIAIILSSTVITMLITSLFTFVQNRKSNSLQYITLERKEWREQIRGISDEISESNGSSINRTLDKLKVRINAYGSDYKFNVLEDSHIWQLIDTTKKAATTSASEFQECKDLLINTISLLLKYDWDRSKQEVQGDAFLILEKISLIVFWCAFGGVLFYCYELSNAKKFLYLLIFTFQFFIMYIKFYNSKAIIKKSNDIIKFESYLKFIAVIIVYILTVSFYISFESGIKKGLSLDNIFIYGALYALTIMVPYYLWFLTWSKRIKQEIDNCDKYFSIVSDILNRMNVIEKVIEEKVIENT